MTVRARLAACASRPNDWTGTTPTGGIRRDELLALRGVPLEDNQEFLLRGENKLNNSLNFHDKRLLREQTRRVATA